MAKIPKIGRLGRKGQFRAKFPKIMQLGRKYPI